MSQNNSNQHLQNDPFQQRNQHQNFHHPQEMGFTEAVKACFDKYADFEGRSRRSEFWYFRLFQLICTFGLVMIAMIATLIHEYLAMGVFVLIFIFFIALIIPSLAVTVRRFHDAGQSGWLLLLDVFCTGGIITLIFGCIDSQPGPNQYGPNPKGIGNDW
jgi:uncharacterized membrane protein YhaH (DUF805 family)